MSRVFTIARMTFVESVRDKILYAIVAFALAMIGSSAILVTLSVGGEGRIVKDLGLSCITLFGLFITVFIGASLVSREIDRRTIYPLLARPVSRGAFVVGKFFGLALTLATNIVVMAGGLIALSRTLEDSWTPGILLAVAFTFLEMLIVISVAILFSTFSTPLVSAIYTLLIFVVGRLSADVLQFASQFGGRTLQAAATALYFILPNLSRFNLISTVVDNRPLAASELLLTAAYGILYSAAVVGLAVAIFQRRDFK